MKTEIFSSLSNKELHEKLYEFRMMIFNCKVNKKFVAKGELGKLKFIKKYVARILTIIGQRKILGS